jgi:hypothetical protein
MTEMEAHYEGDGNIHLLFLEGIQRQTLGCGSGTGVTTYTLEDALRTVEDYLPVGSAINGSLSVQSDRCGTWAYRRLESIDLTQAAVTVAILRS